MSIFNPNTLRLNEFIGTDSTTVTISGINETYKITSVTCSELIPDLVITWLNDSFTFSTSLQDIFPRTLKYVTLEGETNKKYGQVSRFTDIPSNFVGLYRYIPPSYTTKDIIFTISGDVTTTTIGLFSTVNTITFTSIWILTAVYNSSYSNQKLLETIRNGSEFKQAVELYPELGDN